MRISAVVLVLFAAALSSCGGGVSSPPPNPHPSPPPPTKKVSGVSIALGVTTLQQGATTSCTPMVTYYDGSSDSAATCSSDAASVASVSKNVVTGVAVGTANITATSTANPTTTSKPVKVTVTSSTQAGITISQVSPSAMFVDTGAVIGLVVRGSGFAAGDILTTTPGGSVITLGAGTSPTEVDIAVALGPNVDNSPSPGLITIKICTPDGVTCSPITSQSSFAYFGNQNQLAVSATTAFSLNRDPSKKQQAVVKHSLTDGSLIGSFSVGVGDPSIAFDNATGNILAAQFNSMFDPGFTAAGTQVGGIVSTTNAFNTAVAAKDGIGCAPEVKNLLACGSLTAAPDGTATEVPAGSVPWSAAMADGCGNTRVFSYDREGVKLYPFSVSISGATVQMQAAGSPLALPFPSASTVVKSAIFAGGYYVVAFDSSCTAAVMAPVGNGSGSFLSQLQLVNASTMQTIGSPIVLPAGSERIAAANNHHVVVIAYDDSVAGLTRFLSVDNQTGAITKLSSTTTLRGIELAVSADETSLYVSMRDKFATLAFQ
jgi:hypothetical protein